MVMGAVGVGAFLGGLADRMRRDANILVADWS